MISNFRKRLVNGSLYDRAIKNFPYIVARQNLSDYPYFHYKTEDGKTYNFAAYLPLFPKDVKESYGKNAEKIIDGDFLEKLIKQGKIDKQNPWYDAIQKGYVRIVEARDPVHKDKNVLAVVTPSYTAFFVDTDSRGVYEYFVDYPVPVDKIDGILTAPVNDKNEIGFFMIVWDEDKRLICGAALVYKKQTNKRIGQYNIARLVD